MVRTYNNIFNNMERVKKQRGWYDDIIKIINQIQDEKNDSISA